jgi:gluconate 2-dehydrogenase gamma chain
VHIRLADVRAEAQAHRAWQGIFIFPSRKNAKGGIHMSEQDDKRGRKHDESRRAFLVGAALGAAAGIVPEAQAQTHDAHATTGAAPHTMASSDGHGAFLNDEDAVTVQAFAERIWPAASGRPGATEIGVLKYIDLALAGAYADQQDFYRRGLAQLDAYCRATHKKPFVQLDAAQQDDVIRALEQNKASGFAWPSAPQFFNTVRTHVMEGLFADPVYGGNRNFEGWRQINFPGGQPVFTAEDMQSRAAFTRAPIVGIQARATTTVRGG